MNIKAQLNDSSDFAELAPSLASRPLRGTAARLMENVKAAILSQFQAGLGNCQQLLRLALNEAEALASQTEYPYLVFPALAMEKAQAVADWHTHQEFVLRPRSHAHFALAA